MLTFKKKYSGGGQDIDRKGGGKNKNRGGNALYAPPADDAPEWYNENLLLNVVLMQIIH